MLNTIFYHLLNMSIMGSLVGIVVLILIKLFGKYIQKKYVLVLWGLVAFRLVLPISISSKFSFASLLGSKFAKAIPVDLGEVVYTFKTDFSSLNSLLLVEKYQPLVYKSNSVEHVFNILSKAWILGAVICTIGALVIYIITKKQFNTAILVKNCNELSNSYKKVNLRKEIKLKKTSKLKSPLVMGIFKPTIVVPEGINDNELNYVLLHECCHIKRHDNLKRLASILIACIHWFNPFIWLFLYLSERDIEKACDEKVLSLINQQQIKEYASVLISLTQKQTTPLLAFGNTAVKERIISIINYKKLPQFMMYITIIMLAVLAVLLTTNPTLS